FQRTRFRLRRSRQSKVVLRRTQTNMRMLEGKTVLITGQQGATLLVIAKHVINEGAHVLPRGSWVSGVGSHVSQCPNRTEVVGGDVSDLRELDRLLAELQRDNGRLDIVVANCIAAEYPSMHEILVASYETRMNLNLTALLSAAERA